MKLKQYLTFKIDEIKRFCDPTEQQVKKLEVAAKGAVEQSMRKWQEQVEQQVQQVFQVQRFVANQAQADLIVEADAVVVDEEPQQPIVEEPENPEAQQDEQDVGGDEGGQILVEPEQAVPLAFPVPAQPVVPMVRLNPPLILPQPAPAQLQWQAVAAPAADVSSVVTEPVWHETVDRVLTGEQKQSLREISDRRRTFRTKALVYAIVSELDDRLSLSEPQRNQLLAFVQERMDDERITLPHGIAAADASMLIARQFPPEELDSFLSAAQLDQWRELGQGVPAPQAMFNMNGRVIVNGFVQELAFPAAPAIPAADLVEPPPATVPAQAPVEHE